MPLEVLRGHVALVTQEHHIFIGSVRENLALAKPDASDRDITVPRRRRRPRMG